MSTLKNSLKISDDQLREEIVEYMIVHDMSLESFSKLCGLSGGATIKRLLSGAEPLFMTRMKIVKCLNKK